MSDRIMGVLKYHWQCPFPSCKREFVYEKNAEKHCLSHKLWEEG